MDALPPPTKARPFPVVKPDQKSVLGVAFAFAILPVIAVVLRVISRRMASRPLDASDYCIMGAYVLAVALEGVSITGVIDCGIGYDHTMAVVAEYGMDPITKLLKFFWALSLGLSKASILLLYSSVFAVRPVIWTARCAIVFIALYSFTITGVLNLLTDVVVLLLPVPYLYGLQMRTYKKVVLMGVFGVGLLTCVVSGIRIHTLSSMKFDDITYSMPPANIFSGLEPSVAVILACIPLMRPLLGRTRFASEGSRTYGSANPSKAIEFESGNDVKGPFEPLSDTSSQYRLRPTGPKHYADVQTAKRAESIGQGSSDLEADVEGIVVKQQWKVNVDAR
ncbi:hypothetical protein SMACR_00454 [Sordaria macrospora]|uniref:WGS project CABT00000000 data, contig 2.1 n=2 Tax=Sordaria macrospora TaxID=5147 RepID=F7VL60_SORMK|nr:uncharacterized protein SMAC_00454 [Sordaria macrospora k-hell]KAA8631924.1 hypothetical protein SMACR_00454 [Sordaria macrospora]WPJ59204.1 hypothetical protein SMAC4_00454 [Sordaria macrospora]CCC06237.1 unnamed protein product [Sordaria macrospora k-hell]